jgi:sulfonate transport system substrate-binding protein
VADLVPFSRRGVLLGAGALTAGALAACARAPTAAWPKLRIGYQKNGVLLLAKSRGLLPGRLAASGVAGVEWAQFGAGPPLLEAMRAGAVDFGAVGDTPPIFAQAAGAPILYAAAQPLTGAGQGLLAPPGSPAKRVGDLKGRRIGFTKGSSAHLFVVQALAGAGLRLDDIKPVYLSPADASAAFAGGALDAWAIWDPFFAIAQEKQHARLILDGRGVAPTSSFYIASKAFAERAPHVLAALLDALAQDAAWGDAHPRDCAAIIQGATGLPASIVMTGLRRGRLAVAPIDDAVVKLQQANADIFQRLGVIPAAVDVRAAAWTGWPPNISKTAPDGVQS